MRAALPAALAAALLAVPAALPAQIRITAIDWQSAKGQPPQKLAQQPVYLPLPEIRLEPYQKFSDKLRAVITVQNAGEKPAGGLVLRCALSLHLVKLSDPADQGFWAVPFRVEELRVSRIPASGSYEARLLHSQLNEQLKKLRNSGFWADALKLSVMLEPRQGDAPADILRESSLVISKPGAE